MFRSAEWHFETEAGNRPHEHHPDPAQLLRQVHHLCHREAGPKVSIPHRSNSYSFWGTNKSELKTCMYYHTQQRKIKEGMSNAII